MRKIPVSRVSILLALATAISASAGPIKALYLEQRDQEKRWIRLYADQPVAPPASASAPAQRVQTRVYLYVGSIEQSFDQGEKQADAVILPTNDQLKLEGRYPETQRVLMTRVFADYKLKEAVGTELREKRKHRLSMANEPVVLELWSSAVPAKTPSFPRYVCLIATDESTSGSGAYREFFSQRLIAEGIRDCLLNLDSKGVKSVVLPLIGSASAWTEGKPGSKQDRAFRQCRMINSIAGIGLGLYQFLPNRKAIEEIGVVQWTTDLERQYQPGTDMTTQASIAEYGSRAIETLKTTVNGQMAVPTKGGPEDDCHAIYGIDELGRPLPLPRRR
jgi:hypothetical protein